RGWQWVGGVKMPVPDDEFVLLLQEASCKAEQIAAILSLPVRCADDLHDVTFSQLLGAVGSDIVTKRVFRRCGVAYKDPVGNTSSPPPTPGNTSNSAPSNTSNSAPSNTSNSAPTPVNTSNPAPPANTGNPSNPEPANTRNSAPPTPASNPAPQARTGNSRPANTSNPAPPASTSSTSNLAPPTPANTNNPAPANDDTAEHGTSNPAAPGTTRDPSLQKVGDNLDLSRDAFNTAAALYSRSGSGIGEKGLKSGHAGKDRREKKCKTDGCTFHFACRKAAGHYKVVSIRNHTCVAAGSGRAFLMSQKEAAAEAVSFVREYGPKAKSKEVAAHLAVSCAGSAALPYHMTNRARNKAIKDVYGETLVGYEKLRGWMLDVRRVMPGSHCALLRKCGDEYVTEVVGVGQPPDEPGVLIAAFVAFEPCIFAAKKQKAIGHNILFVDGAFRKNGNRGTMLAGSTIDPDGQLLDVAHCLAVGENNTCCDFFLEQLKDSAGDYRTVISDEGCALESALKKVFPEAKHYLCSEHLFRKPDITVALKEILRHACKAETPERYEAVMAEVRQKKPELALKLDRIKEQWARAFADPHYPKLCHTTSNVAESLNNALDASRWIGCVVHAFDYIRTQLMTRFAEKAALYAHSDFDERLLPRFDTRHGGLLALSLQVLPPSGGNGVYEVKEGGVAFEVHVQSPTVPRSVDGRWTCSCNKWTVDRMPCGHITRVCRMVQNQGHPIDTLAPLVYTVEAMRETYSHHFPPLIDRQHADDVDDKTVGMTCHRSGGRPKNSRIPERTENTGAVVQKEPRRCGECGVVGHDKRTCHASASDIRAHKADVARLKAARTAELAARKAKRNRAGGSEAVPGKPNVPPDGVILASPHAHVKWLAAEYPGFSPEDVEGDGNCFYHAMVRTEFPLFRAYRGGKGHMQLRKHIFANVQPRFTEGTAWQDFTRAVMDQSRKSVSEWQNYHRAAKKFADQLVVNYVCQLFGVEIHLLCVNEKGEFRLQVTTPIGGDGATGTVYLVSETETDEFMPTPTDDDGPDDTIPAELPRTVKYVGHFQ
ncbi:hypothetical protein DIPPA_01347, partial [Diplonema papillatum]